MNRVFSIILPLCCLLATACVHPIDYTAADDSFTRQAAGQKAWKKVAVLPFTGDLVYRRVAGEWFAFQLAKQGLFAMIGPGLAEADLSRHGIQAAEADMPLDTAREAGRILGADAVIVGSVKTKEWQGPVAGASLVDVASGKVVATSIHSKPNVFTPSAKKRVVAATEGAAADIISVLCDLAGKPRPPQPEKKQAAPEQQKMPWSN